MIPPIFAKRIEKTSIFSAVLRSAAFGVFAAAVFGLSVGCGDARILAQWVQLGPDGRASARAITDEAACPMVSFDGAPAAMDTRSAPEQTFGNVPHDNVVFAVRGCEAAIPSGTRAATLDGKSLPVPIPNPQRILIFGDTGCRLDRNVTQQCGDPNAWPFPQIAALAARTRPDLVIHVGDYLYRENRDKCPADPSGCGYGYGAWQADFFGPAAPLLAVAPWIMVRGNHEDCSRAGEGWFRFLDRAPIEGSCRDLSGIFVARHGDFGVVVVDGAKADDPKDSAAFDSMADLLRGQMLDVADKVPAEAWLATHRPMNAMANVPSGATVVNNRVQEAGLGPVMPAGVRMAVAGHVHFFQAVDFGGERPPTLVVGIGGDVLEPTAPMSVVGSNINGLPVVNSVTRLGFGYMVWDRIGAEWNGTLYDVDGNPIDQCRLVGRSLNCGQ
jgi:predicted phosphodiesterase